ncbi:collagen-like protein [Phytohabitans suffuscus]|uniref:collagen-like protein n=1 Tax=Phytohabitans suffuscus TaxID=624315 RepID=UPI0015650AC3|nr:collagen-like protein [Phytohabitans suffuscus]
MERAVTDVPPKSVKARPTPPWLLAVVAAPLLFTAYLLISRQLGVNSDGASNALQAREMLDGNLLLRGWTVTDVSFYTNELLLFMLVELVYGFHDDTTHATAALVFTLVVLLVAAAAKGRATGREAAGRVGVAVAIVAVPALGHAATTLLTSPDHTGTAIPLLATWLVLERAPRERSERRPARAWLGATSGPRSAATRVDGADCQAPRERSERRPAQPWLGATSGPRSAALPVLIAFMLAWAQVADPLVMYIGVLPLILVSVWRAWRERSWRGLDARLALAAVGSVVLAQVALTLLRAAGGFGAHAAEAKLAELSGLGRNLWLGARVLAVNYGAYPPDRQGPADTLMSAVHLVGLLAAAAAVVVVVARALRGAPGTPGDRGEQGTPGAPGDRLAGQGERGNRGDRLAELVAVGILVNVGAFVVSALPVDLLSARQVVAVLPLGAVLAGRVWGPRLAALPRAAPVAAAVFALLAAELVGHAAARPSPGHAEDVARWLDGRGLRYGLGEYWNANNITLLTSGRVAVRPVVAGDRVAAYRWESKVDWYDAAAHDATFLVLDTRPAATRSEAVAVAQFGAPVERHEFDGAVVLVYGKDLLVGLPAYCVPETVADIRDCPEHGVALF